MSEGLTTLKNGLTFDLQSKEGLALAIKYLGDSFALVGIEEAFSGFIPSYADGVGVFLDKGLIYKDYISLILDNDIQRLELISLLVGGLFNQSSIALVKDKVLSFPDIVSFNISNNTKEYILNELSDIKPSLLSVIRERINERVFPTE